MSEAIKLKDTIDTDKKLLDKTAKISKTKAKDIITKESKEGKLADPHTLHAYIRDLEVPVLARGHLSRIDKERWKVVVETLLSRGVKSSRQIADITGLNHVYANKYINEIKDGWQTDLTAGKVNIRREELYGENERIADFCWEMIQSDPLANNVPSYLKIIGDTNTRRSRLVGAEQITLAVGTVQSNNIDTHIIQTQAAAKLGVPISALKELGESIAVKMIPSSENESEEENEQETKKESESKN